MRKTDIQCLFIGKESGLYKDLVQVLNEFNINAHVKLVGEKKKSVLLALKRLRGAGLVFISDEVRFSLEEVSDLVWQYAPDAFVVILSKKSNSEKSDKIIDNAQFSRLVLKKDSDETRTILQSLVEKVKLKSEFRYCKHLLGISEKRCQWLVDSSREPIAYITRDLHLYANNAYLGLLQIDSLQELRTIPVKDIVDTKDFVLFETFIKDQLKRYDINRSLVLSLRKNNGEVFRANLRIVPSVYHGKKCLQLWVNLVDKFPKTSLSKIHAATNQKKLKSKPLPLQSDTDIDANDQREANPFDVLREKTNEATQEVKEQQKQEKKKKVSPTTVISEAIKRKDVVLLAKKLTVINPVDSLEPHYLLDLKVSDEQKSNINGLLFQSSSPDVTEEQRIFWDKVKVTLLIKILSKKTEIKFNLLLRLSKVAVSNAEFTVWLVSEITKLHDIAPRLIFLLPLVSEEKQARELVGFSRSLKSRQCRVAMDNFSWSKKSLGLMKQMMPKYVDLSLAWINKIENDNDREIELAGYIRQLESKGIRVIAPCGYSKKMRQIFAFSGVSFCQEKKK